MFHLDFMSFALDQARAAVAVGEVPVGAVIVRGGSVLTQAHNRVIVDNDPTAHAEILAIRRACKMLSTNFLTDCSMYVTLEPCAMCAKAISLSKLRKLYFGAYDFKTGAVFHGENMVHSRRDMPEVIGGVREQECSKILRDFFNTLR